MGGLEELRQRVEVFSSYKGLVEMNADQRTETTMDRDQNIQ